MNEKITLRDIAGFCPEEAVWKMLADISGGLLQDSAGYVLTPDSIVIDGKMFLMEKGHNILNEFLAPEQNVEQQPDTAQMVWALGAVAYYTTVGHVLFGGHGGSYQKEHPLVALPVLPKGLDALTSVLQKCLCYAPADRVSIRALNELSLRGLETCEKRQRIRSVQKVNEKDKEVINTGEKWPEKMIEI